MRIQAEEHLVSITTQLRGETFGEQEYFEKVNFDLVAARRSIILASGFVSQARLEKLQTVLASRVSAGVTICAFVQKPEHWDRPWQNLDAGMRARYRQIEACVKHLRELNVHANVRELDHFKVCIIDNQIIWDGSLNTLSHNARKYTVKGEPKHERMTRYVDPIRVIGAIQDHKLHDCPDCKHRRTRHNIAELELSDKNVGLLVRTRRKALGMTQAEVARLIQVDRRTIANIEQGDTLPAFGVFLKLTNLLGRQVAWLPPPVVPNVSQIIELEYDVK
jgi:DNA-binding XRE family transcriptional regulator